MKCRPEFESKKAWRHFLERATEQEASDALGEVLRLARRLDILDLARMIGHANLGELRTYYRERAEDIAARL